MTDGRIHELAIILSREPIAVENRERIYSQLQLPTADLLDWNRVNPYGTSYSFFVWTLEKFKSVNGANGSWNDLIEHLNQSELSTLVGNYLFFLLKYLFSMDLYVPFV